MRAVAANNNVFIVRDKAKKEQDGLVLPDQVIKPTHQGKIISVGKLVQDRKSISEGRTAIFNQHSGFDIEVDGVAFTVVKEHEIIGLMD